MKAKLTVTPGNDSLPFSMIHLNCEYIYEHGKAQILFEMDGIDYIVGLNPGKISLYREIPVPGKDGEYEKELYVMSKRAGGWCADIFFGDLEVEVSTFQMDLKYDEFGAECALICKIIFRGESEAMTLMRFTCTPQKENDIL